MTMMRNNRVQPIAAAYGSWVCAPLVIRRVGRFVRAGRAIFCVGALTVAIAATARAADPEVRPNTLISVAVDRTTAQELIDLGTDVWGVDHEGGAFHVRVTPGQMHEMTHRGIPFSVLHDDLDAAYKEYRRNLRHRPRAETFTDYHTLDQVEDAMERMAADHPDIVTLETIGESVEGRPIIAMRLGVELADDDHSRPAMLVMGCHHAREWISVEVPLYFADYLVENYLVEGRVTRLLTYAEVWIIPIVNPDGYVYSHEEDRWWRKNRRDNGDGTFGVDNNRNYSAGWGGVGASTDTRGETYRGASAFSEPETRAIRDLLARRPFIAAISYHNYSQLVMYPNGYTREPVANADEYDELSAEMTRLINDGHDDAKYDYRYGTPPELLYVASGDFVDWAHHVHGVYAFTIELRPNGPPFFELPPIEIIPTCRENLPALFYLADETMMPGLATHDTDGDGLIDEDDYCPNSGAAQIDVLGCGPNQQDIDNDGVPNAEDLCSDTPVGQSVDGAGCRVVPRYRIEVRSNTTGAMIDVDPPDIDAADDGVATPDRFVREYTDTSAVVLSAPREAGGGIFERWIIDGRPQETGTSGVIVPLTEGQVADAQAVYVTPLRLEITGEPRIPDEQQKGLGYVAEYTAMVLYSDDSRRSAPAGEVAWRVEPEGGALMTGDGELLTFNLPAAEAEREVTLSAEVDLAGNRLTATPMIVRIFDAETLTPRCVAATVTGPPEVAVGQSHVYSASVRIEGRTGSIPSGEGIVWTVSPLTEGVAGGIRAAISEDGTLALDAASTGDRLIVSVSLANDDGTACEGRLEVAVIAPDPTDPEVGRTTDGGGTAASCGAVGMIGFLGMFVGLCTMRAGRVGRRWA
jgi:carboxypeptidase T